MMFDLDKGRLESMSTSLNMSLTPPDQAGQRNNGAHDCENFNENEPDVQPAMISPIHDRLANALSAAAETIDLDHKLTFKPMFGGYMAYYDGKVFASLSNIGLALKFSPAVQAELLLVGRCCAAEVRTRLTSQ